MTEILNNQMPKELAAGAEEILAAILTKMDELQDLSFGITERLEVLQDKDDRPKMDVHWKSVAWAFATQMDKIRDVHKKLGHVGLDLKE